MFSNKFEKLMSLQNDYIERINKNAVKLDKQLNFLNQVQNSLDKQMGGAGQDSIEETSQGGTPLTPEQLQEYKEIRNKVGMNASNLPDPTDESLDREINTIDLANAKGMEEKIKKESEEGQVKQEETNVEEQFQDATDNPSGEGDKKSLSSSVSAAKVGEKLVQKGKEATIRIKGLSGLSTMQKQEVKGQVFDAILELQVKENEKLKENLESLKGTIEKLEETTDARLASAQRILESTKEIRAPFNIDKLTESQESLVKEQLEKLQNGESSVADVMKIFNFKKSSPEEDRED